MKILPAGHPRSKACAAAALAALLMQAGPVRAAEGSADVAAVRFAPRQTIPVGPHAHSVVSDDVNGDGRTDLVAAIAGVDAVAVLLGNAGGSFEAPRYLAVGDAPKYAATGDFNGDGRRDIIVAEQDSDSIGVLLGNGDGSFRERIGYDSCDGDHEILVTDVNSDGVEDAVVACWGGSVASLFTGVGDGTFRARQDLPTGTAPHDVAAADFNRDGRMDLVFANHGSRNVTVLLSLAAGGNFQPARNLAVGGAPHGVQAADLDQDGNLDIATVNDEGQGVSILWGTSDGFEPHVDLPTLSSPKSIAVADINGDGRKDLLVTNTTYPRCCTAQGSTLRIYVNAGARKFLDPQDVFVGGNPFSLLVGDLDGDGRTDVATANYADLPDWLHGHPVLAAVLDAGPGSLKAKLVRLAVAAGFGLLIIAATWRRQRIAGLSAAVVLVFGFAGLLLWIRSMRELSHITLLLGN